MDNAMRQLPKRTLLLPALMLFILTGAQIAHAHGISDADRAAMLSGGYARYIGLGASHMLTGYDHLLFLLGVMFFLTKFKDIVKFITAFTLGHCITLIGATFMKISMNYFMIDALIALTVVYKGFDNLGGFKRYLNMKSPNLLTLVFVFGLIHGFGLSTRLQQIPLGDDAFGLFVRIISFNVGVELGQIAALSVMLVVLAGWRKTPSFARFSGAANGGLVICGILLFLMQIHGLLHETSPEESTRGEIGISAIGDVARQSEWCEPIEVTVPPGSGIEYKLRVTEGAQMEYSWNTDTGSLFFDFHGEPTAGKAGYFESFKKGTSQKSEGVITAPFTGSIGWYWKNNSSDSVVVTVKAKGHDKKEE
jgi:hypothetical protein